MCDGMAWRATWMWPCGSVVRVEQGYKPNSELMICSTVNISGREHMVLGCDDLPLKVKEEYTRTHRHSLLSGCSFDTHSHKCTF